jgi:hypothetical protein
VTRDVSLTQSVARCPSGSKGGRERDRRRGKARRRGRDEAPRPPAQPKARGRPRPPRRGPDRSNAARRRARLTSPARDAQPPTVLEQAAELAKPGAACRGDRGVRAAPPPQGSRCPGVLFDGDDLPGGRRPPSGRGLLPQDGLPSIPSMTRALLCWPSWPSARRSRRGAGFPSRAKKTATATSTNPEEATCDRRGAPAPKRFGPGDGLPDRPVSSSDCWHRIGVSGDGAARS